MKISRDTCKILTLKYCVVHAKYSVNGSYNYFIGHPNLQIKHCHDMLHFEQEEKKNTNSTPFFTDK